MLLKRDLPAENQLRISAGSSSTKIGTVGVASNIAQIRLVRLRIIAKGQGRISADYQPASTAIVNAATDMIEINLISAGIIHKIESSIGTTDNPTITKKWLPLVIDRHAISRNDLGFIREVQRTFVGECLREIRGISDTFADDTVVALVGESVSLRTIGKADGTDGRRI